MQFTKHVGKRKESGVRVVVVYMTLPDDKTSALAVDVDSLPNTLKDDLMEVVASSEGQSARELYNLLHRRSYRHGGSLLEMLHNERKLMKLPTSDIIMTPHPSQTIPLDELNTLIRKMEDGTSDVPEEELQADRNTKKQQIESLQEEERSSIGHNLLYEATELEEQAKLLVMEATKKRKQAEEYLPAPKKSKKVNTNTKENTKDVANV